MSPTPDDNSVTVPDTADANEDGEYSEEELLALTKAQIAALATQLGYEGISTSLTKAAMIEAFLVAQEAG